MSPKGRSDESADFAPKTPSDPLKAWEEQASREAAAPRRGRPSPGSGEEAAPLTPGQIAPSSGLSPDISATIDQSDLLKVYAREHGNEYIKLSDYPLRDIALLKQIPFEVARQYKCFPLREERDGSLLVAISDPLNVTIQDDLQLRLGRSVRIVIADEEAIRDAQDKYYGIGEHTLESVLDEEREEEEAKDDNILTSDLSEFNLGDMDEIVNQPEVIRIVNLILLRAIRDRASDIHIEPFEGVMRVRYRVDGVLREIEAPPKSMQLGMISRLKVMSNMNISESRKPQDGRIKLNIEGREVDLRISSMPTVHGEGLVMRVLDRSMMMVGISQIGMMDKVLERFVKVCRRPNGILLVTGPTGSGKTTTLYSALIEINDPGEKFITTEEPVEYDMEGIVQVNINEAVGLTFARCLRAILRQDPDRILVGEIRDLETAQIAVQAALTGHLVMSTLHTNSAAATITRLIDMGVEPFLITSTLQAIVGQRLVRTICPNCKMIYQPTPEELLDFGYKPEDVADITFYQGAGCGECNNTGFKGRMGMFEMLEVNERIRDLILERASTDEIHAAGVKEGMITMRQDGWMKICLGYTTFNEVARQTPAEDRFLIEQEMSRAPLTPALVPAAVGPGSGEEAARAGEPAPEVFGDQADLAPD